MKVTNVVKVEVKKRHMNIREKRCFKLNIKNDGYSYLFFDGSIGL